jgi:DNA-binding beta-propeller fold protein YncE
LPEPAHQAASRRPYVYSASGAGVVDVFDPVTGSYKQSLSAPLAAGAEIKSLAVNDEETLLIAASNRNHDGTLPIPLDNGSLFLIDLATGEVSGQIKFPQAAFPLAMRFAAAGATLYVLDRANFTTAPEPARLYVIDVASRQIAKTVTLPVPGAAVDMALTPDDAVLFLSVQRTDERGARYTELYPLDTRTATFNGAIRLPGFTTGPIAMNPAGTRIYAPHRGRPLQVIDTATYQISEIPGVNVPVSDPYGAGVSPNGRYLVLSVTNEQPITVVDLNAGEIVSIVDTGALLAAPAVVLR